MEIRVEVKLNRDVSDQDDESLQNRIDAIAAELANGTGPWHERFDRLRDPASDGIDLRKDKGLISRFQRWAVMTEPGPALVDFFADTQIVPAYEVSESSGSDATQPDASRTVTLSFGLAREAHPMDAELAVAREELLKVANAIVRLQGTVAEVWAYLKENPEKRRSWIGALALGDEEAWTDLEADVSDDEEGLLERLLEDLFSALWPDEAIDGDPFVLYEPLDQVFDAFPASVTVKPDGEVVEAVGFHQVEDAYAVLAGDVSWAVADVLDEIVSPNLAGFWADADLQSFFRGSQRTRTDDEEECDRDCQLDEILARPFVVRPAEASDIVEKLEKALTPLGEYRLRWIRNR